MVIWLLIIWAAISQESISTNIAILGARSANIPWIIIHFCFFLGTLIDIVIPYYLAQYIIKRIDGSRLGNLIGKPIKKAERVINRFGQMKGLFILGVLFYIIVDSAAAGILKIPLKKTIVVLLVSDLVWYITVVSITIGTKSIISDMKFVILIFAGIVILYTIISKKIFKTVTRI